MLPGLSLKTPKMMSKISKFAPLECLLKLIDVAEKVDSLYIVLLSSFEHKHSALPILRHLLLLLLLLADHVTDNKPIEQPGIA